MSGSSLLRALDNHNRAETERLLELQPEEIAIRDPDDRVALHYAAETMDLEMFQRILEQDVTLLDCEDRNGHTPMLMAVMGGRTDLVKLLLSRGANIHHRDRDGHSAVHWAVVCGQLETLTFLLAEGADVEAPDLLKATPLHYATATEETTTELALAILHTLLKGGAKPNCRDIDERTPILWSASNGNLDAMHSLKQAGGDMQAVDRDRLGVLHCAASHGYHETIDFFMEAMPHSAVDQRDRAGHTALFYAVTYGHYEAARRLLEYGASPNHQDHRLRTPSHCAAAKGQMRMLKLLKQYNASFEIQNYRGDLPIHESVQAGCKDVVEWLLALQPSSINSASHEGRTCLHLAAAQGNLEMVVLLCTKGCFVNPPMLYKDNLYTPLDLARRKNHQVIVDYLSTKHEAKAAAEMPEGERKKNRLTFEEQVVQAKLIRGRHLYNEDEENEALLRKSKSRRRRSHEESESVRYVASTGVNTTARRASSAGQVGALAKTTSTTDLSNATKSKADERIEQIIREEVQKMVLAKQETAPAPQENEAKGDVSLAASAEHKPKRVEVPPLDSPPNFEDEFEDLPAISDTSEESSEDEKQKENYASCFDVRKHDGVDGRASKSYLKNSGPIFKPGKPRTAKYNERSIRNEINGISSKVKANQLTHVGDQRLLEAVNGEFEVYEDDWEELGVNRPTGKEASRRYIHEKSIFQELTHLKRMQIQYGRVQERILVRSLVNNFCKMHGLDPSRFKFQTFYSWEKFLYDTLSDQLKLIYMEERARLSQASSAQPIRSIAIDRFETRIRQAQAVPLVSERLQRLNKVYGNSTMTSGKAVVRKNITSSGSGHGKRCDCLRKHLMIKQET